LLRRTSTALGGEGGGRPVRPDSIERLIRGRRPGERQRRLGREAREPPAASNPELFSLRLNNSRLEPRAVDYSV
jgi:hypothetical protein